MGYYSQRIYVNEIGFHAKRNTSDSVADISNDRSWYFSASRSGFIIRAVEAAQEYLDHFLELSKEQLQAFMLPDWLRLIYAVLIIGALQSKLDAPGLDLPHARKISNVQKYLNNLITQLDGLASSTVPDGNPYLLHVSGLCSYYVSYYQCQSQMPQSSLGHGKSQHTAPDFSFAETFSPKIKMCVELYNDVLQSVPEQNALDEWDQILKAWPDSLDPSVLSMNLSV